MYIQVKLEQDNLQLSSGGFIDRGSLHDLRKALLSFRNRNPASVDLSSPEGNFAFRFSWRADEGCVSVTGSIPCDDSFWNWPRSRDPLLPTGWIKTRIQFEFWMPPERLSEPIDELDRLLDWIKSVEEYQATAP
jgi:hypothetical protein